MNTATQSQPPAAGEAAHTPATSGWSYTRGHKDDDGRFTEGILWSGHGDKVALMNFGTRGVLTVEQDAAFIVRACNSHAALVNALKLADELLSEHLPTHKPASALNLEHIRAALKAATF